MDNKGNIILKSNTLVVNRILKKTRAKLFRDLKVGDKLELSVEVKKYAGINRNTYATYIVVENVKTKEVVGKSFNELPRLLDKFELIESN